MSPLPEDALQQTSGTSRQRRGSRRKEAIAAELGETHITR
jgi:hypothetical protein